MKHIAIITALLSALCPAQEPQAPVGHPSSHAGGLEQDQAATESDPDKLTNQPMAEIMRRLHALEESVKQERAREGAFIHPWPPPPAKAHADAQADAVAQSIARAEYEDARTRYEYQLDLLKQLQAKLARSRIEHGMEAALLPDAERTRLERGEEELKRQIRIQEETVKQERKLLAQIVRARGIKAHGGKPDNASMESAALEQTVAQLRQTIQTLLRYDGDELIAFAAGLDMAEGAVRTLHPRYVAMKAELEGIKNTGPGHEHPLMIAKNKELEAIRKQLEAGIVALRESLQAKLQLAEARLDDARKRREAELNELLERAGALEEPDAIRQRLDRMERMLEQVLRRLDEMDARAKADRQDARRP